MLWAASALTLIFAPLLIVVSVWLYPLVFGFSELWFAHYALAALANMRALDERLSADAAAARRVDAGEIIELQPVLALPSSTPPSPPPPSAPATPVLPPLP